MENTTLRTVTRGANVRRLPNSKAGKPKNRGMGNRGIENILVRNEERQQQWANVQELRRRHDRLDRHQELTNMRSGRSEARELRRAGKTIKYNPLMNNKVIARQETVSEKAARLNKAWGISK